MKKTKFNEGWKYWTGSDAFALVWGIAGDAREVTLPHDIMQEKPAYAESKNGGNTGFRDGDIYNYVKFFFADPSMEQETVMLKFDGIYMNSMVYINGALAAKCPYGYSGFYVPLNSYLKYGQENEIRVIVRNGAMPNSRWYSGGGIYQDVWLLRGPMTYLAPEGVQAVTESLDEIAVVKVQTTIWNRSTGTHRLRLITEILEKDGQLAAVQEVPLTVFEGEKRKMTGRIVVKNPMPWSVDTPYLYQMRSRLYEGEELLDENVETFGIRTLALDAVHGLRVNGKSVKLKGACIHHDSGILGAATFLDAEYRRIDRMKKAGFNAIRMAHHPAAPALLKACDELGMYVMDEVSDMWTRSKTDYDYGMFFFEWWEKDVEAMVRKDFNHSSVIMYSVGNEIPEIGTDHGAKLCHEICEKIKELDPIRYTLASINGVFASGDKIPQILDDLKTSGKLDGNVNDFMTFMATQEGKLDKIVTNKIVGERIDMACANTDIAGYNYMTARYEMDGKEHPDRVIVGSETNPPDIADNWEYVKRLSYVIGDFTWTGWDYIGEAGIGIPAYPQEEGGFQAGFPCQLAYCGDIDITGFRRPLSYFREIVFGERKVPYIAVQNPEKYGQPLFKTPWVMSDTLSSWTYPGMEKKPVIVEVYAPGDQVELFLNGTSLGKKASGSKAGFRTLFETVYEPGTLEAVAYEGEKELGRMVLQTAGNEEILEADIQNGKAGELVFVEISNRDKNGIAIENHECNLTCETSDDVKFWFGSGNPKTKYPYITNETSTWHGRALLVVRKTKKDDPVNLKVRSENKTLEITV